MTITVPLNSPSWVFDLVRQIENEIEERTVTLTGGKSYSISDLPDPAVFRHKMIVLSDGASNKNFCVSDGSAWRYADGATV